MSRNKADGYLNEFSLDDIKSYEVSRNKLKNILEDCQKTDTMIRFHNRLVEPVWMTAVYKVIIDRVNEEMKTEQRVGIQRALKKKAEGTGSYGRPRIPLPEDFEFQIKKRVRNSEDLSKYCEEIQMKKSTFYRRARACIDAWDQGEKVNRN